MSDSPKEDLIESVRAALQAADALGQFDAALHLNEALIVLTGAGVAPNEPASVAVH